MASPKIMGNPDMNKMAEAMKAFGSKKKRRMRKASSGDAQRVASAKRKYRGIKYTNQGMM